MTHKAQNGSGKSKVKVNGVDDYAVSDAPSLSTSRLRQQLSSYDEDEIISYAQTRYPANNILHDAARPTSNRSSVLEFLFLTRAFGASLMGEPRLKFAAKWNRWFLLPLSIRQRRLS